MILLGSLFTTFEASSIFLETAWAEAKIILSLKSNHQIKLSFSKSLLHKVVLETHVNNMAGN